MTTAASKSSFQLRLEGVIPSIIVVAIVVATALDLLNPMQWLSGLPAFQSHHGQGFDRPLRNRLGMGRNKLDRVYGVWAGRGDTLFGTACTSRRRLDRGVGGRFVRVLPSLAPLGEQRVERNAHATSLAPPDHDAQSHVERGRAGRAAIRDLSTGSKSDQSAAAFARAGEERGFHPAADGDGVARGVLIEMGVGLGFGLGLGVGLAGGLSCRHDSMMLWQHNGRCQ